MNAPGKGLLKVSGILLIIFGGLSTLLGVFALLGAFMPSAMAIASAQTGVSPAMIMVGAVILTAMGAIYLVAGILGVKNCDKPEKAQTCFIIGVIMLLMVIVDAITTMVSGQLKWYNLIIGFVLPIIYLLGAIKNKEVSGTDV